MSASPARQAAFDILGRIEKDAAYSSELLHSWPAGVSLRGAEPDRAQPAGLSERDWALVTEIVFGCLRWQGEIDYLLAQPARRPVETLDPEVRVALRMGCYQIRYLERVPDRAAVSESVELVKRARKRSATGFVNAVLRRLPARPEPEKSRELAHPQWLAERWIGHYGPELAAGILDANLAPPAVYLRLNPRFAVEETLERLQAEGIETEPAGLALARRVVKGRPARSRLLSEGRIRIQDLGSQSVVPMLELDAVHSFLDVCAAPGGKTLQAIETRGSSAGAVAGDRHLHRLRTMRALGGATLDLVVLDATQPLPFQRGFDRILVDAPCSGTGTLARNPEIKWRLGAHDIAVLAEKQKRILANSLGLLGPGGILVYATCSLEPEENEAVVSAVLQRETNCKAGAYFQRIPGRDPGDGFYACQIVRA